MRPEDKKRLLRIVQQNLTEGIQLRQVKISDSATYKYVLDPSIDTLTPTSAPFPFSDPSTSQDSHSYALCRLIGTEMETHRIRTIKPSASSSSSSFKKRPATPSQTPQIPFKKVACDFFGRPIVAAAAAAAAEDVGVGSEEPLPVAEALKIWYSQNDGVSNAVRRNLKISSFFE
jgi:hypothetical protein